MFKSASIAKMQHHLRKVQHGSYCTPKHCQARTYPSILWQAVQWASGVHIWFSELITMFLEIVQLWNFSSLALKFWRSARPELDETPGP